MRKQSQLLPTVSAARRLVFVNILLCAMACVPQASFAQRDAKVLHRNLAELVGDSHTIVLGRVVRVQAEPHPQAPELMTVAVTLDVAEVWKGQAGKQFTFRAFVNHPLDFKQKLGYETQQEVLLMMTQPSEIGLSSPAGLEQGRFRVHPGRDGRLVATNGVNNAGLFYRVAKTSPKLSQKLAGLPARQALQRHTAGPILLDDLRTIVQAIQRNP